MKRRLVLLLTIATLAGACVDGTTTGQPSPFSTSSSSSTTTTSARTLGTFPPEVVDAVVEGCTEDGDPAVCECTIEEIEGRLTIDEFLSLDDGDPIDRAFILDATAVCVARVGSVAATTSTTSTTAPTTTTTAGSTNTTEPAQPLTLDEITELTISDLQAFWTQTLPEVYDVEYEPIDTVIPYRPSTRNVPACGGEPLPREVAEDNAFYCRPDDFIAWDAEGLFPDLFLEFGDFAISLVLAHEWGHAIQNRAREGGPTIQTELQADCFAGAWTGAIDRGERPALNLEDGDIEEAMAGYLLFRDPAGTSPNDPGAHGSAFDRVNAFRFGVLVGVEGCRDTSNEFPVAFIPLTAQDLATGGDLPFDEAAPLLVDSLEAYWTEIFPAVFGEPWTPVSEAVPYDPVSGDLPVCPSLDITDYENRVFYCPDGDFVAWDNAVLFPSLYQSIGDFALGQVLAHEWATAAQYRAGLEIEGLVAELQADCMSGAFTSAVVPQPNPTPIVLSAGDLDEAVAGFIQFGDDPALMDLAGGSPFERFDAFQVGFFGGIDACLTG